MKTTFKIAAIAAAMIAMTGSAMAAPVAKATTTHQITFNGEIVGTTCTFVLNGGENKPVELGTWHRDQVMKDQTTLKPVAVSFTGCSKEDVSRIYVQGDVEPTTTHLENTGAANSSIRVEFNETAIDFTDTMTKGFDLWKNATGADNIFGTGVDGTKPAEGSLLLKAQVYKVNKTKPALGKVTGTMNVVVEYN